MAKKKKVNRNYFKALAERYPEGRLAKKLKAKANKKSETPDLDPDTNPEDTGKKGKGGK